MPGFTAACMLENSRGKLWIDYILYFYAWLYSSLHRRKSQYSVVNWLHFVFLCLALQPLSSFSVQLTGCELITFCIFMPGFTALNSPIRKISMLWIDYILYFYAWLYSVILPSLIAFSVVNWLHFVFLCLALQRGKPGNRADGRCELITFCIFMPGFTAFRRATPWKNSLWIDYILYFYAWLYSW